VPKSSESRAAHPRAERDITRWDREADVVVVGQGSAGTCAAIDAAGAGADTLVLERAWRGGGTSAESSGQIYLGGGTPLQRRNGFDDDAEEMAKYLIASCGPGADEAKIRRFSERSVEHYHWLEKQGVHFEPGAMPYESSTMAGPGIGLTWTGSERAHPFCKLAKPAPRGHNVTKNGAPSGEHLMQTLIAATERAGVRVQPDTDVQTLVVASDGRVVGVVARTRGAECLVRARRGVVLTTGGFIRNEDMIRRHAPELLRCGRPIGAVTSDDGSGIRMGTGAGGEAIRMGSACIVLGYAYGNRKNISGILVNAQGQRYVNEDVYQSLHGEISLLRQNGEVYLIADDSIYEPNPVSPEFEGTTYPLLAVGQTIEELEREIGLPPKSLVDTVARYNANALHGADPEFHKEACWLRPLSVPPFAAIDLRVGSGPYSVFTLGGLRTDVSGQVLDADGIAIAGLYAAGRTASGIPAQGYNSGLSLADCSFSGRCAGASAAAARS
jgi:succinate dehydrogenase/fumarate reductase flavoprotein subunit